MKRQRDIELELMAMKLNSALSEAAFYKEKAEGSVSRAEYDAVCAEKEAAVNQLKAERVLHETEIAEIKDSHKIELAVKDNTISELTLRLRDYQEIEATLQSENMDYKALMEFWRSKQFGASSESMVDEMDRIVGKLPQGKVDFMVETMGMINRINRTHGNPSDCSGKGKTNEDRADSQAAYANAGKSSKNEKQGKSWKKQLRCSLINKVFGIDLSELGPGAKVVQRMVNGKKRDEVTEIEICYCIPAKFYSDIFKVANCNVPGVDGTKCSKRPKLLFKIPVDASFARFYLEKKFGQNLSEGQIIEEMRRLGCTVDQATLNRWMHTIIGALMEVMLPEIKEEIRMSRFTHNDETRIIARSYNEEKEAYEYKTEYIHGILSPSANLFLMIYDNGSRSHEVQMEIFEGSNIEAFVADRCPLYTALQKEFESPPIRGACWIHFRRYLLHAFSQDSRLEPAIQLLARLFAAEKIISRTKNLTETQRVRERQDMCLPIVEAIFNFMQYVKDAGSEYGVLAHRAADYLLDDREGFSAFLSCGLIEIGNNAIERCFRHIAIGRHNWQQCGSHEAAKHTAFMYSLVESCRMNGIYFGDYIEHVLREIQNGNTDIRSLLPNHVKMPNKVAETPAA